MTAPTSQVEALVQLVARQQRIQRVGITLTTAADGSCTAYSATAVAGLVIGYAYVRGDLDNATTDITVTEEDTAAALLTLTNVTASARYRPRVATHDVTGSATGALDAPAVVGRIKVVVAQGGNAKTGTLYVYIDGSVAEA
jgi:hypothetical protein